MQFEGGASLSSETKAGIGATAASRILDAARGLRNTDPGRPNYLYELNPQCSDYWFDTKRLSGGGNGVRLARYGVHGDGSCAYHSVCTALNIDDYVHQSDEQQKQIAYKFRCSFADKLTQEELRRIVKKSRSRSPPKLQEVQEALCDPKIWAEETTIRYMADTLGMNLIFLDMTKNHVYCGVHHDDAVKNGVETLPPTMIILWVNHSHFEPLAQIMSLGPKLAEVRVLFEPAKNKGDADLVRALMKRYKSQCELKRKKE